MVRLHVHNGHDMVEVYTRLLQCLNLKGAVSGDFLLKVYLINHLPPSSENIRKSRCTTDIIDTGGKFATGINDTGGKFCHQYRWCC